MVDILKPCPFCGSLATTDGIIVVCSNEDCSIDWIPFSTWNTRPIEDALRADLEHEHHELLTVADANKAMIEWLRVRNKKLEAALSSISQLPTGQNAAETIEIARDIARRALEKNHELQS